MNGVGELLNDGGRRVRHDDHDDCVLGAHHCRPGRGIRRLVGQGRIAAVLRAGDFAPEVHAREN